MRWIQRQFPKRPTFHLHQNSTVAHASGSVRAAPTAPVIRDTENQPHARPYSQHDPNNMSTSFDDDDVGDGVAVVRDMVGKPLVWTAGGVNGIEADIENDAQLEAELMRDAYPPDGIPPPMPNGEGRGDRMGTGPTDIDEEELEAELMRDVYPTDGIPPPKLDSECRGDRRGAGPVEYHHEQQRKQQQQQQQQHGVVNEISSGLLDRIIAEGEVERMLKQQQVSSSDMLESSDMGWIKKLGDDDDDEVAQAADILQQTVRARRL